MSTMVNKDTSLWWLCDSPNAPRRSPLLHSTLAELDDKTKSMLRLIEEDADSFAQRAEMYYKKRPELVSLVEEFYRMHRSLAEKYDKIKPETTRRLSIGSPFNTVHSLEKPIGLVAQMSDAHSDMYDPDDCAVSEVDDPENEVGTDSEMHYLDGGMAEGREKNKMKRNLMNQSHEGSEIEVGEYAKRMKGLRVEVDNKMNEREIQIAMNNSELWEVKMEMESMKEENLALKEQLHQKDEEKREVIRQLTSAMEDIKLENNQLRKSVAQRR